MTSDAPKPDIYPPNFERLLGDFHKIWLVFDVTIDFSITTFLKTSHLEGHVITSGMEFGRKIRALLELIRISDHPKKSLLMKSLKIVQGSMREIITHSYISSNSTHITFIHRSRGGAFKGTLHEFGIEQFRKHVEKIYLAMVEYQRTLGVTERELQTFSQAALSEDRS